MELEQSTTMDFIKGSAQSSVWACQVQHETPEEGQRTYQPDEAVLHNTNSTGKGMNLTILSPAKGK